MNPSQTGKEEKEAELPIPWQRIQSALWLIGLAIIAWQGWWWPGILVLAALSGLFQAGVQLYLKRQEEQQQSAEKRAELNAQRIAWLPAVCPQCGGPLSVESVQWSDDALGACPYCKANLRPQTGTTGN